MIECYLCHTVIDVDDDVAYDLGWREETKVIRDKSNISITFPMVAKESDKERVVQKVLDALSWYKVDTCITIWYCPHCVDMEENG